MGAHFHGENSNLPDLYTSVLIQGCSALRKLLRKSMGRIHGRCFSPMALFLVHKCSLSKAILLKGVLLKGNFLSKSSPTWAVFMVGVLLRYQFSWSTSDLLQRGFLSRCSKVSKVFLLKGDLLEGHFLSKSSPARVL